MFKAAPDVLHGCGFEGVLMLQAIAEEQFALIEHPALMQNA